MVEVLLGLIAGILAGATGAGVGLLVVPLLILAGYQPAVAVSTGVAVLVVGKLFASVAHHRLGHWPGGPAWALLAGGAAGVSVAWWVARVWLSSGGPAVDLLLRRGIAIALLFAAAGLLLQERSATEAGPASAPRSPAALFLIGLGVGAPFTLTSVGSGSLLSPALLMATNWETSQIAAASSFFGSAVGMLSLVVHAGSGSFDSTVFTMVLLGLLPGVFLGAQASRWIPRRWFHYAVSVASALLAVRLLLG